MPLKAYRNEHAKVMLFFVIYKPRGTYFFFFEKKVHFVCEKGRIDLSLHAFWQQRPGLEDGRSRIIYIKRCIGICTGGPCIRNALCSRNKKDMHKKTE